MEILAQMGCPSGQLRVQNRMAPGLSLAVRQIYVNYEDGQTAAKMTLPRSLKASLTWFDINGTEKSGVKYVNEKEAWAVIVVASWLIKNGHNPATITILAAYRQQAETIIHRADQMWPSDWNQRHWKQPWMFIKDARIR